MNECLAFIFDTGSARTAFDCCYPVRKGGAVSPCGKRARPGNKVLCEVHTRHYEDVQKTWLQKVFVDGIDPATAFGDHSIAKMAQLSFLVQRKLEITRFSLLSPYEVETGYPRWRWNVTAGLAEMIQREEALTSKSMSGVGMGMGMGMGVGVGVGVGVGITAPAEAATSPLLSDTGCGIGASAKPLVSITDTTAGDVPAEDVLVVFDHPHQNGGGGGGATEAEADLLGM